MPTLMDQGPGDVRTDTPTLTTETTLSSSAGHMTTIRDKFSHKPLMKMSNHSGSHVTHN